MSTQMEEIETTLHLNEHYIHFLQGIKERLKAAQIRAALAVNKELIRFYWELGNELINKQKTYKWGEQFLDQFSRDMRNVFPEMQGFSKRNLEHMRRFATLYSQIDFAKQAVSQIP